MKDGSQFTPLKPADLESLIIKYGFFRQTKRMEEAEEAFQKIRAAIGQQSAELPVQMTQEAYEEFLGYRAECLLHKTAQSAGVECSECRRLNNRLYKIDAALDELNAPKHEQVAGLTMELSRVGRIKRLQSATASSAGVPRQDESERIRALADSPVGIGFMAGRCESADFEADTLTFKMQGDYHAAAGEYAILPANLFAALEMRAAKVDQYQQVCAAAYQLAGLVGAPVRFLDALGDAANGEIGARTDPEKLLPVDLSECDEFAPSASAPSADVEMMKKVIAWANNSLYGSHGFFLSDRGGPADEHHLDFPIEKLKAYGNEQWRRAEKAESELKALQSATEESEETMKRLRSLIPGCDCANPAQCWEPCGTLGHSEKHARVATADSTAKAPDNVGDSDRWEDPRDISGGATDATPSTNAREK